MIDDETKSEKSDDDVLHEAGDIDPRAWAEVIRPSLSDREGWGVLIGTTRGSNVFCRICQRAKGDG